MAVKRSKKIDFSKTEFKPLVISNYSSEEQLKNKNIIGSDETGVGDYLTPLVAAAVYVPHENIEQLIELGVKDSKSLSDQKILDLFPKIKDLIKFRVNHLTQKGYNNLAKYMNAHELKMFLHLKSITTLEKFDKVNEDLFVDDAEKKLYECVKEITFTTDYDNYIKQLIGLNAQIDNFFDKVLVMDKDENIKNNRIALLTILKKNYERLADFSALRV